MGQPVIDIKSGRTLHNEWLVRFDHEAGLVGVLRPAEISGAIMDLDLSMLARAVLSLNMNSDGPGVAVNLSGASMSDPRFEHALNACLSAFTGPAEKLIFELTETWNINELDKAAATLARLRLRGHPICLDDVGAGAASIRYLRAIKADWLKIDGDFVVSASQDPRERAILESLLSLREPLDVKFIAEGIETAELLDFATTLGFDAAQGFYIGRPQLDPTFP
ncbi:MAG: EAL domain-containing protein [Maricaulaceae bacterium]